jgi:hypothetical protein
VKLTRGEAEEYIGVGSGTKSTGEIVKRWKKILAIWFGINLLYGLSFVLLPHKPVEMASFASYSLQTLLLIVSIYIFRLDPARKNRFIFLNFALFFSLSVAAHLYSFVGEGTLFFSDNRYIRLFVDQYVFRFAYFGLLAFSIVYITIDLLFRDFWTETKYALALALVLGFMSYHVLPFLQDPLHLHRTQDVLDWKAIDQAHRDYVKDNGKEPSIEELSATVKELYAYSDGKPIAVLYPEAKAARVAELYPYVAGMNWVILVYKPLYQFTISMSLLCLGFILLFFGYQYMKDPPQGAYIEKIMFFLLLFCTLELVHAYSSMQILEWDGYFAMTIIGFYVSTVVLFLLAIVFGLRLRFITTANGEFYEQELALSPGAITRWRDMIDDVVVEKFFNRKMVLGRLMVDPKQKEIQ